ncbi:DUF1840 domain-containing protein [Granulosicoccus antarcticus]|uniref:DUF1840 domain-containing protein n=1 Tax=Granulosicoccus antarcticus IMCC3135 TaxID=1192854 RepID=A0A2Z2NVY5_9GAMM|nr:DUF1840 domain-containing protein [Granulosicoccus antarcticus]ASJ75626.1 hypothetical protein IMCC3135_27865 [Granulosicoccus antarcticus IMCC3135]
MLVTFKTSAYSDITMFGEPAVALLKLMGQSGNVPGAILAADVPKALETLHEALAKLEAEEAGSSAPASSNDPHDGFSDDEEEMPVALHTRAGPLVELLEAAAAVKENVLWDS